MMTFPTEWKVIKFMFQTTNQKVMEIHDLDDLGYRDTHVYRKPPFDKDSIDDSVDGKTFQHSHVPCFSTYNPVVFLLLHKVQSSVAGFICDLFGLSQNDGYQNSQHDHMLPSDKLT